MKRFVWVCLVCACQPATQDAQGSAAVAREKAHGAVVASVGSQEIGLDDVAETARETGLEPAVALDRLVAEDLLQGLADQKGYADSPLMRRETKKAEARALLELEVERTVSEQTITREAVQAKFAELKPSLDRPEIRELVRLVWPRKKGEEAAPLRALAERALARLKLVDPESVRAEMDAIVSEAKGTGENVKLSGAHAKLGKPNDDMTQAAFARSGPGLIPEVFTTRNVVAVVLLEAIIPASEAKFEDHEAEIRAQLVLEGRRARTEALLHELRGRTKVTYDEDAIARAFADDSLGNAP